MLKKVLSAEGESSDFPWDWRLRANAVSLQPGTLSSSLPQAALSSLTVCFVVFPVWEGNAEQERSWRVHYGYCTVAQIPGSLSHLRRSHCSRRVCLYFASHPCTAGSLQSPASCLSPFTPEECEHNSKYVPCLWAVQAANQLIVV